MQPTCCGISSTRTRDHRPGAESAALQFCEAAYESVLTENHCRARRHALLVLLTVIRPVVAWRRRQRPSSSGRGSTAAGRTASKSFSTRTSAAMGASHVDPAQRSPCTRSTAAGITGRARFRRASLSSWWIDDDGDKRERAYYSVPSSVRIVNLDHANGRRGRANSAASSPADYRPWCPPGHDGDDRGDARRQCRRFCSPTAKSLRRRHVARRDNGDGPSRTDPYARPAPRARVYLRK